VRWVLAIVVAGAVGAAGWVAWSVSDRTNESARAELERFARATPIGEEVGTTMRRCRALAEHDIGCAEGPEALIARVPRRLIIPSKNWILIMEHENSRIAAVLFRSDDSETHAPRGSPADRRGP